MDATSADNLSYDHVRAENIKRNNQFLAEIGLPTIPKPTPKRQKRNSSTANTNNSSSIPVRRSSRIADIPAPIYRELWEERTSSKPIAKIEPYVDTGTATNEPYVAPEVDALDSTRLGLLSADLTPFLDEHLAQPYSQFGKAAIMTAANHGKSVSFNKYSGVAEWNNALFLWVNIGGVAEYPNMFLDGGRYITWYGGSRMHKESRLLQRLLTMGKQENSVFLFVRLEKSNYACLGSVVIHRYDINVSPVFIEWKFVEYDKLRTVEYFKEVVRIAGGNEAK